MAVHMKRVHGNLLVKKTTLKVVPSLQLNSSLARQDSVKSINENYRPTSPSPKKLHVERKDKENKVKECKDQVNMEESGKQTERKGDHKVDASTQWEASDSQHCEESSFGQKVRAGLMTELEIKLRLALEEITELKQEKKQQKAHNARKHAGYESDYEEILVEKQRIEVEIGKIQSEKDLLLAKVESLENIGLVRRSVIFWNPSCKHR